MTDEIPFSQLSIIVDLTSSSFDFKKLYGEISSEPPANSEHHYWHFGGLRSFTIPFQTDDDEITIKNVISKLELLQHPPARYPPYWLSYKKFDPEPLVREVIKKNYKLGRFNTNKQFQIEYTSGAFIQLNRYVYDTETQMIDRSRLIFYHDRIDLDYTIKELDLDQNYKEKKMRKTFKAEIMDKCAVVMKEENKLILFINMSGNPIEYQGIIDDEKLNIQDDSSLQKPIEPNIIYKRTAPKESRPFYSTIRLVISLANNNSEDLNEENQHEKSQNLSYCYKKFQEFFQRNHIHECSGRIFSRSSIKDISVIRSSFMLNETMSFIKQYCWHMLLSIGYRFQQRLTDGFIQHMNSIVDDDEFYQTSLHIWRRSNEYYFLNLINEFKHYQDKIAALALLSTTSGNTQQDGELERWSLHNPPEHYAYVPSVTVTPTTICVKPLKLVKTNRVLREKQFGGNLMFALVDVKDETGTIDLFPHDYRSLRWKTELILESGFDVGKQGRIYRYLHHSQSQLKDKQFWFYYHDGKTNFSFEEAFAWMGDFQEERIVAKHAARIAQCFTSAEATISIPKEQVKYVEDIETDDQKYKFTDGVGTMSSAIRDSVLMKIKANQTRHRESVLGNSDCLKKKVNLPRKFSAIQIRYGGCKGVISVNPDLDDTPHQLRIRQSMKKFQCDHNILELCRVSKPRPLYLNRQIIVLLSHRKIDDRTFLLLQNKHQQTLSESLVYPKQAYELLAEKINRTLFPLRALIHDAQLNLIQEPFFRQLLITTGKFELTQMKERTRLKLPKNSARNMIGIVDEYGILEYGQVFIQYTELNDDFINNSESEKTVILDKQKVVVTKNPCYQPGDIRVFQAIDVPRLRHLKDVIVFPQRGARPHPNEISGSDLDGDEYAVIWDPDFIPQTENDNPYDYDSKIPMKRVEGRPVDRSDIQDTVLDISEQSCVGKLCSIHLAYMDRYGVADGKTVKIAGYISEELDSAKTGHHPLQPKEIMQLQTDIGNERPDYFDKPYYKLYPSKHILGQLYRASVRFEPNWKIVQTPPTTVCPIPMDPLLVHDLHFEYTSSVEELAHIYREQIMDIMYVYRFSSDIDLLCRFDSTAPQSKTPLSKQQTESACLVADSAQVELRQLIHRIRRKFYDELRPDEKSNTHRCYKNCLECKERKMAKASALYIHCYTDTTHARRMLSLPWLFAPLLIETRKLNIEKQKKLLSPAFVTQMLEIQPYRLIGQSLRVAANYIMNERKALYFQHVWTKENPLQITLSLRKSSTTKRLFKKCQVSLIDYLLIEILHHYICDSLTKIRSPITDSKPLLLDSIWQHILTRFVLNECSPLALETTTLTSNSSILSLPNDLQYWSDEQACFTLQRFIDISLKCAEHGPDRTDYAHANEYLVSALQNMATTNILFSH